MAHRRRNNSSDSAVGALVVLGLIFWFVTSHPWLAGLLVAVTIGVAIYKQANKVEPITHCQVCGNHLSPQARSEYTSNVAGQSRRVCSHCYQNLQRQNSREAMRNLQSNSQSQDGDTSQAGQITRG